MYSSIEMKPENRSSVTKFTMLGLTDNPDLQIPLFILFLSLYLFTLLGNICILVIVRSSAQLQTPMYFFLAQLALLDIMYSCVISPRMLSDLITEKRTISFYGCIFQTYFFSACASTEFFILASMAFDRCVAICNPLIYTVTMTKSLCIGLVVGSYTGGFIHSLIHAAFLYRLDFCGPDLINHFTCDYPVLTVLSCNDISLNELLRFVFAAFVVIGSLVFICVTYCFILRAILRIRTTSGRRRAASTCMSHFTCVFLFCGSSIFMEITPNSRSSEVQFKVSAVVHTVVVPALNPLIYSLRNNDVKAALRKLLKWGS